MPPGPSERKSNFRPRLNLAVIVFVVNMGVARRRFMLSWGGAMWRVEQLRRHSSAAPLLLAVRCKIRALTGGNIAPKKLAPECCKRVSHY